MRQSCLRPTTCSARATSGRCGTTRSWSTPHAGTTWTRQPWVRELEKGRLFAFLDVTSPEPAAADSPLRRLPNVVLTPHIAGAKSFRTGAMAVEELRRFFTGEPQIHQVTRDMLPVIA